MLLRSSGIRPPVEPALQIENSKARFRVFLENWEAFLRAVHSAKALRSLETAIGAVET
jgi:hypothetical protein